MEKEANNINSESAELPESLLDASHTNSTNRRHWGSFSGVTGLNQSPSLNKSSGHCSGTVKQHFPHHKTTNHFCKSQQHTRPTTVIIWMTNAKPPALCCTPRLSIIFCRSDEEHWWSWCTTLNTTLNLFYFTLCIIIALEVSIMDATTPLLVHTDTRMHIVTVFCSTLEPLQPHCLNINLFFPFHSKG